MNEDATKSDVSVFSDSNVLAWRSPAKIDIGGGRLVGTEVGADLELERDYWRKRAEDAECKEREAARLATTAEIECDTLRVTLAATRTELDRALSLAVEDRKRLQDFARVALLRAMSDLSERHWCAGWLTGTEYFLWSAVEGNRPTPWGMDELRQGDIDNLRMLRELAGGWWVWADEEAGEKFVGLDEMRQMAETMQKIGNSTRG